MSKAAATRGEEIRWEKAWAVEYCACGETLHGEQKKTGRCGPCTADARAAGRVPPS